MGKSEIASKMEIRSKYLSYRNSLSLGERKEKSSEIWKRLKQEEAFQKAQCVLVYMDYRSEVMTTELVQDLFKDASKRVFAPKVEGMEIHFYEVCSMDDFVEGYQGIREPEGNLEKRFTEQMAQKGDCLILVPGAVFDRQLGRMGYGKGFYDRYLATVPELHSIALAYACQIAKHVPVDEHDIRMDMVITENEVIK